MRNNINFWRGNQNYSYLTAERGTMGAVNLQPANSTTQESASLQTEPPAASNIPTQITTQQAATTTVQNDGLGTPPAEENMEIMPSSGGFDPQADDFPVVFGGGGGYGGGGGAAAEEEVVAEEIPVVSNKILGLEPKYFYGGLILLALGAGYMLKNRNTKAKIK